MAFLAQVTTQRVLPVAGGHTNYFEDQEKTSI